MPTILKPTITETFLERVKQTPGVVGFQYKSTNETVAPVGTWKEVTFREFYEDCENLVLGLREIGVKPGDSIAILSKTRYEWALADMAILGSRAVTIPIYASSTTKEILYLLDHSDAKFLFIEDADQLRKILPELAQLPKLQGIVYFESDTARITGNHAQIWDLHAVKKLGESKLKDSPHFLEENLKSAKPDELITICYTSGTTGVPKGVMLSHENLMSVLGDAAKIYAPHIHPEKEVLLAFLPFSHIIGKVESMATYVFGWRECYAESVEKVNENLKEVRPTILFCVPRIFEKAYARIESTLTKASPLQRKLFQWAVESGENHFGRLWAGRRASAWKAAKYNLYRQSILDRVMEAFGGRLRFAICGGAPLPREIGEYFQILGILILEGYGLTETCAPVTLNTVENLKFGTVGKPLPEVEVKISDDGEILLKTKQLFSGYYKMDEETKAAFSDGWYRTGDVGFIDPQGYLHITDRKKDLIITSGGKNVAPQKIEGMAKSLSPLFEEVVVIGDRRNYLTALITLNLAQAESYAHAENILYSDPHELTQHVKIQAHVQRLIDELNRDLARFETLKKFMILPKAFTIETGELTPSLKVKRGQVTKKYRAEIESMYRES